MANWEAGTSSDPAEALGYEYDVFLNFRGEDTRHNFTDFLYNHFIDAGVHTFRDEEKLPVGDVISDRLERAINNSKLYIPIFSRNYASSKWCLRELKLIIDNVSKAGDQKSIFPIFLLVKPDDVKLKIQPYSDAPYKAAFEEHEKKFPDEVEAWKTALAKVDERKGWVVEKNTSQAAIVKSVVGEVLEKLKKKQKLLTKHLVGLDVQIKDLTRLLDVDHDDARLIGIYGMGGIGKTTIAKIIFNRLCSHFGKYCSFLEGVREMSTKEGIISLQKKLISDIGDSKLVVNINDIEEGMQRIKATLSDKKVLVVLDDINEKEHIMKLIGTTNLHSGSRIIITTRDMVILQVEGFKGDLHFYEMLKMDDGLALQLFCWHAFARNIPSDDYRGLSSEILSRLGGLPLAIEVVGSLLNRKNEAFWKETLARLKKEPEEAIRNKLRISYDDLDEYQKQIFLDIACFFIKEKKTNAIYMWDSCSFYPERGIDTLTTRCLIKIVDDDKFWMHDQLIELGRQIVREESQDLGRRSRLWIAEEALQIIQTDKRKNEVKALEISTYGPPIEIGNKEFEGLPNLRFLNLKGGTFVGDFARCYSELKWFSWSNPLPFWKARMDKVRDNFKLDFRADNLHLDNLVVCKFYNIDFKDDSKAWDLIKEAKHLKVLSITYCSGITTIPDISRCSTLERLTLYECWSLERVESFIGDLQSLIKLKIKRCSNFTKLPEKVGALVNLKYLSLWNCERLRELPSSLGNLNSLTKLDLSGTNITGLPKSIVQLKSLRILRFQWNPVMNRRSHDWQLFSGISTLVKLEELDLSEHKGLTGEVPAEIGEWSSLRTLNLGETSICRIPRTINKLHHLQTLNLTKCYEIQELPELPTSLTCLLLESRSLLRVPNLSNLTNLVELLLSNVSVLEMESKPDLRWIVNLSRLKKLELVLGKVPTPPELLRKVPAPPELASLSYLEKLVLGYLDLKPLTELPSSDWSWRTLSTLKINHCEGYIPLEGLPQLEILTIEHCVWFQRLSIHLELRKLQQVKISACAHLVEIQVMGLLKSLEDLTVYDCKSLTRISGLSYLKNLSSLSIRGCYVLTNVEGINELESLKELWVVDCFVLRKLIDASCTKLPNDCILKISKCGYTIKNAPLLTHMKHYREEILLNAANKISFTIHFHLGLKKSSKRYTYVGGIKREKKGVDPYSVTYEGLAADVKNFGFRLKTMWYKTSRDLLNKIKSERDVNILLEYASRHEFLIHLYVEGGVDSEWEGEYDDEMMEMLTEEQRMKTDMHSDEDEAEWYATYLNEDSNFAPLGGESEIHSTSFIDDFQLERGNAECFEAMTSIVEEDLDTVKKQAKLHEEPRDEETISGEQTFLSTLNKDGPEFDISGSNEVPDSASVGESETDGNSSIVDFRSEPGNTECFEATGNKRQMIDGRIGRCDSIDGGKTVSIKNRKKGKDEIGEPANPSDFVGSGGQTRKGVKHYEKSCKATTKVGDQRDFFSVKRDKNVEIDRVPKKTGRGSRTGCASNPGRYPTERGRGRGRASSSRNGESLSLDRDATSTLGRGTASNSGRDIASSSQTSTTSSLRRDRGSTSGRGTTLTSGRGMTLSLGMGRDSSSRTDTTKMGTTSNPRRGITSSSRSSASLSIGRGRGSTLGEGATMSSGRGMTLSLGMGRGSSSRTDTTKMGTASIPGRGITSSSPCGTSLSTRRGRDSTSGNDTTASSRRGKTLSSGRGATKMGTSLRSGTNKGLSSAKAEPQTSRSLEEQ